MHTENPPAVQYNVALILRDLAAAGMLPTDLARRSRGRLNDTRVSRFLNGEVQTPRTLALIASVLRQPVERYLLTANAGAGL